MAQNSPGSSKEKASRREALGKLAGTTEKYIDALEHGKPERIRILAGIATTLGVPLEQLYEAKMKPSVCAGGFPHGFNA